MKKYHFIHEMKVRDYECDLQGVVNNANYQHYMEHTRHEYLESLGENFGAMHEQGIDAFVSRVEIHYRTSLHSGDRFTCTVNLKKNGPKWVFEQEIYREPDHVLAAKGAVDVVIVENGKLTRGEYFDHLIEKPEEK